MKQFTTRQEPVRFKIDDDEFTAAAEYPAGLMVDIVKMYDEARKAEDRTKRLDMFTAMFEQVLHPDSYKRLHERLHSRTEPIGLTTLTDVSRYLMGEVYGGRPTQPPSPSITGQSSDGTSSTDGQPPEE